MSRKKLAVGAQDIARFHTENLVYVDKTQKIHEMMDIGVHNFIVRPRRFGKSLFLDTVGAIYEGRKELFEGTWIYDKIDWEAVKRPVIRLDFNNIPYKQRSLEQVLKNYLLGVAGELGLELNKPELSASELFQSLIRTLGREKGVVVLVDEYEKAVTDFLGENGQQDKETLNQNIGLLKEFYGVMKGAGARIHRSYITGVSKIGQIGILSDLNMLNDLTLDLRFTSLFGYTERELCEHYGDYLREGAAKHGLAEADFLAAIRRHYNGYSWDGIEQNRVYNPFSLVNFFQNYTFGNYWFATGTPTVLVKGARRQQYALEDLENIEASEDLLKSANLREFYSLALLFQAGYLTIREVRKIGLLESYTLGFPNNEVRESFARYLLAEYIAQPADYTGQIYSHKLRIHLELCELPQAFSLFQPVLSSTPYDIAARTEAFFHAVMHTLLFSTGMAVLPELHSLRGRTDTLCIGDKVIYIFEYKLDQNAEAALQQIHDKGYAQPFLQQPKTLYLVGIDFNQAEKQISGIAVEKWNGQHFERVEWEL